MAGFVAHRTPVIFVAAPKAYTPTKPITTRGGPCATSIARAVQLLGVVMLLSSTSFIVSTKLVGGSVERVAGLPDEHRFLAYKNAPCNGLNHQIANLREFLADAATTHRIAIIEPPCLIAKHNKQRSKSGKLRGVKLAWNWDDYVDLSNATAVDASGAHVPIHYVHARDFSADVAHSKLVTTWRDSATPMSAAKKYDIILRDMAAVPGGIFRHRRSRESVEEMEVTIPPARSAILMAQSMKRAIGPRKIVAVHVRRGDRLRQRWYRRGGHRCPEGSSLDGDTSLASIERTVRAVLERTPGGDTHEHAALFLMTDERAPHYFDELHERFDVFTAASLEAKVPGLGSLVSSDNYMLYTVEKQFYNEHSDHKIATFAQKGDADARASLSRCWGFS